MTLHFQISHTMQVMLHVLLPRCRWKMVKYLGTLYAGGGKGGDVEGSIWSLRDNGIFYKLETIKLKIWLSCLLWVYTSWFPALYKLRPCLHVYGLGMTTSSCFKCVPTFCGSIIIHICLLLFFLIEYSSITDLTISEKAADSTRAQVLWS